MHRIALLPILLVTLLLGACDDVAGLAGRSIEGEWSGRIEGETVWMLLSEDQGRIRGSGEWGFDPVFITGDRSGSELYLVFEFSDYNPIEFEGTLRGSELEGQLFGSGYGSSRVRFFRE